MIRRVWTVNHCSRTTGSGIVKPEVVTDVPKTARNTEQAAAPSRPSESQVVDVEHGLYSCLSLIGEREHGWSRRARRRLPRGLVAAAAAPATTSYFNLDNSRRTSRRRSGSERNRASRADTVCRLDRRHARSARHTPVRSSISCDPQTCRKSVPIASSTAHRLL